MLNTYNPEKLDMTNQQPHGSLGDRW
jgi:hypothetical protein